MSALCAARARGHTWLQAPREPTALPLESVCAQALSDHNAPDVQAYLADIRAKHS